MSSAPGTFLATATSPWAQDWATRGNQISRMLGENLPRNYPTFDRYSNGIATSIKSIDTSAVTYQSARALERVVGSYIRSAANGVLRNWGAAQLEGRPIVQRVLRVAIPDSPLSAAKAQVLNDMIRVGATQGVQVEYVVVR
jgi:hypothetical protein